MITLWFQMVSDGFIDLYLYLQMCLYLHLQLYPYVNLYSVLAPPHGCRGSPSNPPIGPGPLTSVCKAEKHLHADPKPTQTMHKREVPVAIIYICRAKQRLQTPAY